MKKRGFSLIETIIYLALLSSLMLVLTQIFTSIIQARLDSEATSSIQQNADYIMNRLIYDVTRSTSIDTPLTYGGTASPSMQITIDGVSYTYQISNGVFQILNNLGANNLSDSSVTVSNLGFTKIGKTITGVKIDTVRVNFRLTSVATRASGKEVKDYQITVAPR